MGTHTCRWQPGEHLQVSGAQRPVREALDKSPGSRFTQHQRTFRRHWQDLWGNQAPLRGHLVSVLRLGLGLRVQGTHKNNRRQVCCLGQMIGRTTSGEAGPRFTHSS